MDTTQIPSNVSLPSATEQVELPNQIYTLRITEEPEFQLSKKSNQPMLVFQFEIVDPTEVMVRGEMHNVAGLELQLYCTLQEGKMWQLGTLHRALELPTEELQFNPETGKPVGITYTGGTVYAQCRGESVNVLGPDEKPLINPLTGKNIRTFSRKIVNILTK